jgi:hypothetical protein
MKFRLFLKRLFFVIFVIGLLLLASFAYFEFNKEKLLIDFKAFIREQILKSTGRTVTFSGLEGGVFSGITLNKLVISQAGKDNNTVPVFKAEKLVLNYRYWDIIFGRFDRLKYIRLNSPVLYLNSFGLSGIAKEDKQSLLLVNSLFWVQGKDKMSFFLDNGSIALDNKYVLVSRLDGQVLAGKDSLTCSWLKGYILGNEISISGSVAKIGSPAAQIDLVLKLDGYLAKGFCRIQDNLAEPTLIGAFNFKRAKNWILPESYYLAKTV